MNAKELFKATLEEEIRELGELRELVEEKEEEEVIRMIKKMIKFDLNRCKVIPIAELKEGDKRIL